MQMFDVTFKNTEEILEFVKKVEKYPYPMDLKYGSILLDAKSLMGLMELGCNHVVTLVVHSDEHTDLCRDLEKFIVS